MPHPSFGTSFSERAGEPERVNLAEERDRELLSRLQLLRPDGRLTRARELLLCPSSTPRIRYAFRPALGARSTSRSELSDRGLAEELRAALDAFSSANPAIALPDRPGGRLGRRAAVRRRSRGGRQRRHAPRLGSGGTDRHRSHGIRAHHPLPWSVPRGRHRTHGADGPLPNAQPSSWRRSSITPVGRA